MIDETLARVPDTIQSLTERMADFSVAQVRKRWGGEAREQCRDEANFRRRLLRRWGRALGGLRLLITLAREFGEESKARPVGAERALVQGVITRLHMRGCQLANEALVLMENGYADGAMAR